jgi:hypothetical protein
MKVLCTIWYRLIMCTYTCVLSSMYVHDQCIFTCGFCTFCFVFFYRLETIYSKPYIIEPSHITLNIFPLVLFSVSFLVVLSLFLLFAHFSISIGRFFFYLFLKIRGMVILFVRFSVCVNLFIVHPDYLVTESKYTCTAYTLNRTRNCIV